MKNNKGITLISLVVTIIVLLILAGVSIAMLAGDNSILKRGQQASDDTAVTTSKELIMNAVNEAIVEFNAKKYADNDVTATLPAEINSKVTAAITEANKMNGVTVAETTAISTEANGVYTITYKNVLKSTGTVSYSNGSITWVDAVQN